MILKLYAMVIKLYQMIFKCYAMVIKLYQMILKLYAMAINDYQMIFKCYAMIIKKVLRPFYTHLLGFCAFLFAFDRLENKINDF
ncbi:MAG: hypothetical protein IT256_03135 [Chitinophagaceae bacterium]|nr:hypothetical protein [Chitinophagaceae bacterium]